jgi:NADH dehydrogenase
MSRRIAVVIGASGFIGRHLVKRLAADGWIVRAAERDTIRAEFLKPMGDVGQVVPVYADVTRPETLAPVCQGAEVVVNLVGILYEKGRYSFDAVHVRGAANAAAAAKAAGARAFVQMSALGADKSSPAAYSRSKAAGEEAVQAAFPGATIFRPSVVFGPEDDFFNRFAKLSRISPILPVFTKDGYWLRHLENGYTIELYGSGGPNFQPVYVSDVADAMIKVIATPSLGGKVYELGGPRRYSLKEVYELVRAETGRRPLLVPIPFGFAAMQAAFLQYLPKPPLTPDQVKLMAVDNVVRGGKPGLVELGITPTACEAILPTYLSRYRA